MRRLEGKVALVTGAGGGVGAATAQRLASEGAQVGVLDLNAGGVPETVQSIENSGGQALELAGDVTDGTNLKDLIGLVTQRFGRLDILNNNAGINRDALATRLTEDQWDQVLSVNLKATFCAHMESSRSCASRTTGASSTRPRSPRSAMLSGELRCIQSRRHRPHPHSGAGVGTLRHTRELRGARRHGDAHDSRHSRGDPRKADQQHTSPSVCPGERDRRRARVSRER
jgi:NAD(P)-dependent dehydrogenase (short-subunit alcohol dehydrogenase family)